MALGWLCTWRHGRAFCVAGVALVWHWAATSGEFGSCLAPLSPRLLAWQAWHLAASTATLRGRRGAWRTWTSTLRGRRGAYGTGLALVAHLVLCAAGVALGDIGRHFAWPGVALMALGWPWWRAWFPFAAVVTVAVCVAGVALGDINLHFAWQQWYLVTSTFTLRGGCGTYGTSLVLVAFVTHTHHFVTHTTLTHNFVAHFFRTQFCHTQLCHTNSSTQLCHRFLPHTALSHNPFTHNFVTRNSFTHDFVTHNSFTHTTLLHTCLSHTSLSRAIFYTQLCHIQLLHTQTYTHTQNTVTHSSFTQPVLHHRLSFPPFPSHFHICLVIIGKNWHVGLSGPLILWDIADKQTKSCAEECAKVLRGRLHGEAIVKVLQALVNVLAFPNLAQAILDPARLIPSHSCAFWGPTRQSCQSHAASIILAGLDMKIILANQQQFVFRPDQAFHLSTESLHI